MYKARLRQQAVLMGLTLRQLPVWMFHDLMLASAPAVYRILPNESVDMVVMAPL